MKKMLLLSVALVMFVFGAMNNTYSTTGNNVLLEFCTGNWCGYCPCGEYTAEQILINYPNTMVLAYHWGNGSNYPDPWYVYNGNDIINLMGFNSYPSGIAGRRTGIIAWNTWSNPVTIQSNTVYPGVSINIQKSYNSGTRVLTVTATATAMRDIDTTCNINFVVTEDHLWATQSNYDYCTQQECTYCEHMWVVRNMVNSSTGEQLSTGLWTNGTQITKTWNTTLDAAWVDANCNANVFVYFVESPITSSSFIQQTAKSLVITGLQSQNQTATQFSLAQNYPNPFNPTTNIHFTLPKDGDVSLKIYDILGNEVATVVSGNVKAGTYNAEVDASNWASGVYFYKLTAGNFVETKKMSLIK